MTSTLPQQVQAVFDRFITTEFTTIDPQGQPITWPVTPYYRPGAPCIDVTTGLGYPKKADDAAANRKVALLFSDPTGCDLDHPPQVLVQGTATVDDRDLDANRRRYLNESLEKLPNLRTSLPRRRLRGLFDWYFTRIYVSVRPERVYIWPDGDPAREPQLLDAHMEEVRSGHDEEPPGFHAAASGGGTTWDARLEELGSRYPTAVLTIVAPDGFPFSLRVPVEPDPGRQRIRIGTGALGLPVQPGLACLTAHAHGPRFEWQTNFHVRGDLVEDERGWCVAPHRVVVGLEQPPGTRSERLRGNALRMLHLRARAKRERRRRAG